ncbi:hypothetical protein ACHHYP_04348 [Achlya hypogyna]|uniref:Zinc finger protein n=1 Tax=Achlya hypogyna TaxID=1202772 RepID=A0A1V9Z1W7_ACHHY|nr:hypothetical protein ACHHYP_04348 [Achlya hypogyna]
MGKRTREAALLPIAKRLQQSADQVIAAPKAPEEDIEAKIKALEADLDSESEVSSSDEDDDEDEDAVVNLSKFQDEVVPALPEELLPKASCKVATHKQPKDKEKVKPKEKVKIVGKVPFACKPCGFIGADLDDFLAHKKSSEHAEVCGQVVFKCKLCVKEFTSAEQLAEHKLGKWHLMRHRTKKEAFQAPRVCYDFVRGSCAYGDKCNFDHSTVAPVAKKPKKARVCNQFAAGKCRFGDSCIFAHTTE